MSLPMAAAAPPLAVRPAGDGDIEAVRLIRNSGRETMTHDTSEIDAERQAAWWASLDPEYARLYVAEIEGEVVGYGFLSRMPGGAWWVSLAVAPEHRGEGIGTAVYRELADRTGGLAWAEIRRDNAASVRAAEKAGYSRVGSTERGLLYVRYRR